MYVLASLVVRADMVSLRKSILVLIAVLGIAVSLPGHAVAQDKSIVVASTTSATDSGLFGHLLPIFTRMTGITVNVMYSDFVLIGPKSDPAGIKNMKDVAMALKTIRDKKAPFISRGDGSGTHLAELALWNKDAGIDIQKDKGAWYRSISQGMGATLNMAGETNGYALTDRGTWISFKRKGDLEILVEGDRRMFNQYAVILVNPNKHPNVKKEFAQVFIDWLVSPDGQKAIGNYQIDGEQLFYPNADDPNA
jgi:tungstate transport system substrate-binding protein